MEYFFSQDLINNILGTNSTTKDERTEFVGESFGNIQELPYDRDLLTLYGFGLDEFGEGPFGLGDITLGNSYTYGID